MDQQAANLLSTLKRPSAQTDAKITQLNALKSDIKHYRVPDTAQPSIFECIRLAITQQASSTLTSTALSTLGHLLKRLKIQDNNAAITQLSPRLFPALQERLGDLREPVRAAASQALSDLYPFLPNDVEAIVRDDAIAGSNARAKETGMRWVARMHQDEGMPFKSYTQSIVARLEDADGTVREAAKSVVIDLFSDAPDRAKLDLKKQLKAFAVRVSITTQVLAAIGAEGTTLKPHASTQQERGQTPDLNGSTRSLPPIDHSVLPPHLAESLNSEAAQPPPQEIVPMDPIYLHSQRELEDIFRDMLPHFEGKETEHNWIPRDKAVLKIRRILKGNSPNEYHHAFMAGIKSAIEGIIKVASTLRTTMATNGCQLVRELAKILGPALDPHAEILLQTFIKMSAGTKHIAAENGRITANEIFQNCSYNMNMMRHIWLAAQDKNVQVRQCSMGWLTIVLNRQASYRGGFESSGGLELAEKSVKRCLDDANPKVKEKARAGFWTFNKTWPDKASKIMAALDPKSRTALERDPGNPNASLHQSLSASTITSRTGDAASRAALREVMAEQRRAKGKMMSRPNSAMADLSPAKSRPTPGAGGSLRGPSNLSKVTNRQVSGIPNGTGGDSSAAGAKKGNSLMSGPVRRPRRPEAPRPQTADPYSSRRLLRPVTPANDSPAGSPGKGTGASKASAASSVARERGLAAEQAASSPACSPVRRSPALTRSQLGGGYESRPTSKGSETATTTRDDDLTMVMPKGITGRGQFSPGHKRPGLGETRSADSALPIIGDDGDFTMVMPKIPNHLRARSPLAYRSPIRAMLEEARNMGTLSPEVERLVHVPNGNDAPMTDAPEESPAKPVDEVQIYEDPFTEEAAHAGAQEEERKVLGELPVNESTRGESPTQSVGSSNSDGSPQAGSDAPPTVAEPPQDRAETSRNRRLLASGIERIRTKTLDAHGFRRVQDLAKSRTDIWEGGKRYDELMAVVLEYLQTIDQDAKHAQSAQKLGGLKAQALSLVRALLVLFKPHATKWHAKALVTVLISRKGVESTSHLVADMQRTLDTILDQTRPDKCLDAVLDFLPAATTTTEPTPRMVTMGLQVLRQLAVKCKLRAAAVGLGAAPLDADRRTRLVQVAARYVNDADAEVRKVDVDLASELFDMYDEASRGDFWAEFKGAGADEGRLGLLTYYITKNRKDLTVVV